RSKALWPLGGDAHPAQIAGGDRRRRRKDRAQTVILRLQGRPERLDQTSGQRGGCGNRNLLPQNCTHTELEWLPGTWDAQARALSDQRSELGIAGQVLLNPTQVCA